VCRVHVGDRRSDSFRFLVTCLAQRCAFLVRAAKNRRVEEEQDDPDPDPAIAYLFPLVRARPGKATQALRLSASHGKPAREATVQLTWGPIRLLRRSGGAGMTSNASSRGGQACSSSCRSLKLGYKSGVYAVLTRGRRLASRGWPPQDLRHRTSHTFLPGIDGETGMVTDAWLGCDFIHADT